MAIKRVRKVSFKEGMNLGAIKELQALQEVSHPNVLKVGAGARASSGTLKEPTARDDAGPFF